MKYKVFDDVVPKELADLIEDKITCDAFPWFVMRRSVYEHLRIEKYDDGINFKDKCSFGHTFTTGEPPVVNSQFIQMPIDLLNVISDDLNLKPNILRIRANYTYPLDSTQPDIPYSPHVDGDYKHIVLLYYVNDSDGDTIFFQDDKPVFTVSPKKGRFVIFDGNIYHASMPPKQHDKRIVINYNLELDYDFE